MHGSNRNSPRESEELLKAIQNSLPANIAVLDGAGTIIAVNERWEQYARENGDPSLAHTGVGVNYFDVCRRARGACSEGALEALEGLQALLAGKIDEFTLEYPCPSPGREDAFFLMRAVPLKDKRVGLVVAHLDITDQKRIERALRESEEKHRTLVERANDGIVVLQDAIIKLVNPKFLEMSGYTKDELLNKPFADFLSPEERALLCDRYRRRMCGEDVPAMYETTMTRKDGSKIEVEINAGIITYEGKPADLVIFRDITQRKAAERALREAEEKLRALVNSVDAAIFTVGSDLRLTMLAGRTEKTIEYTPEEFMADPNLWKRRVHQDDYSGLVEAVQKSAAEGKSISVEFRMIAKSGQTRWVRATMTPHYNEYGEWTGHCGVAVDITDRVLAQQHDVKYAERMAALAEISQTFVSYLDVEAILDAAAHRTGQVLQAIAVVASVDPATGRVVRLSVSCPDVQKAVDVDQVLAEHPLTIGSLFGSGEIKPVIIPDLKRISPEFGRLAVSTNLGPGLIVPVFADGEVISIMAAVRMEGEPAFNEDDLWFLTEVASHASAALTNARLYKRQARIAETLQRSLIPDKPAIEYLDIATAYFPAQGDVEVGGDFFDIIPFGDGTTGIVIGDVAGKGVVAAIHTAEAKYMLRAFAYGRHDPGSVVTALNKALCAYADEFTFVTMFYGLLMPDKRRLEYVNAGQEIPLVLCTRYGIIKELRPASPVLGVIKDLVYESDSIDLEPDDLLLCYTDGVTDMRSDSDRFGYERLLSVVSSIERACAQTLLDRITEATRNFGKGHQVDDQVIVVLRPLD